MTDIRTRRVYESAESGDGERVWPRGFSKDDERVGRWIKEVAPTDGLRRWFHETGDFANFSREYRRELRERPGSREALDGLEEIARGAGTLTLVFASKDEEHNPAPSCSGTCSNLSSPAREEAACGADALVRR